MKCYYLNVHHTPDEMGDRYEKKWNDFSFMKTLTRLSLVSQIDHLQETMDLYKGEKYEWLEHTRLVIQMFSKRFNVGVREYLFDWINEKKMEIERERIKENKRTMLNN